MIEMWPKPAVCERRDDATVPSGLRHPMESVLSLERSHHDPFHDRGAMDAGHRRSNRRMHTLFLSSVAPSPCGGGAHIRLHHLLTAVRRVSDVTLVCFVRSAEERKQLDALKAGCRRVYAIGPESWGWATMPRLPRPVVWLKSLVQCLDPRETALLKWWTSEPGARLVRDVLSTGVDLVWAEHLSGMALLPPETDARVIVDLYDLEHQRLGRRLRHGEFYWRKPLDLFEYLKLRRLERGLGRLPHEFVVCSHRDRKLLGGGPRVWVAPNGVDLMRSAMPAPPAPASPPVVLFVGTMNYAANVDAVRYFHRRILPRLRSALPDIRFVIAGRDPAPEVSRLHDGHAVIVTGTVPSIEPYLREATVVVVPLRFGAGTRLKILEAFAYGRPVVSTTIGADGLDVDPGRHLLLADGPVKFAGACRRIIADRTLREALIAEGRRLAVEKYDWTSIESIVERIVASTRPCGSTNARPALVATSQQPCVPAPR
jgi:glycosyltransferase involved in cell wall biosynthesis